MQITIELPDDIANQLAKATSDLTQKTLESLIIDDCRTEIITSAAASHVLNLSAEEVDTLLKQTIPIHHNTENNFRGEQLPTIAETFNEIRQICIEEDFDLELQPKQDRQRKVLAVKQTC